MKKIITLLLAVISIETLFAEKVQIGDLYYFLDTIHQRATVISLTDTISHYKFTPNTTICIPDSVSYNHITYSVTSIGEHAFKGCFGLRSMTCLALTPPITDSDIFHNVDCSDITLYVPAKSVQAYKDAEQWNIFKEILPTSKFKMRRKAK